MLPGNPSPREALPGAVFPQEIVETQAPKPSKSNAGDSGVGGLKGKSSSNPNIPQLHSGYWIESPKWSGPSSLVSAQGLYSEPPLSASPLFISHISRAPGVTKNPLWVAKARVPHPQQAWVWVPKMMPARSKHRQFRWALSLLKHQKGDLYIFNIESWIPFENIKHV